MRKKNGFAKPTEMEKDIEESFSSIISTIPSDPKRVRKITKKIRGIGAELKAKRKANIRRLIKK